MSEQANIITAPKLCALTGLTDRRHRQLAKEGYFPPPIKGEYPLVPTLQGLFKYYREQQAKRSGGLAEEQLRAQKAKADLLELELHKRRGKLVEIAAAEQAWEDNVLSFRAKMLSIPVKAAPQLMWQKSQQEMQGVVDKEIREALAELAKPVDYKLPEPEQLPEIEQSSYTGSISP